MIPTTVLGDVAAIVPVRAGSKGLARKNLLPLAGVPLYLHAIRQGLRTVGEVFVSTDISEIKNAPPPSGCTVHSRPCELGADDTPMVAVIKDLIEGRALAGKTLVLLQATSPLRLDVDIIAALELFRSGQFDMVLSVTERERAVLKYGTLEGGRFTAMREQAFCFFNRQQLPAVYGPNGAVYVFDADRFMSADGFPCERIGAIEMPVERSVDIDSLADLRRVEDYIRLEDLAS